MKCTRSLLLLSAALLALGIGSCKKEDPEKEGLSYVNGVPYYHFTDADQRWLQVKEGDLWKLENARGYQRVYRVTQAGQAIQQENLHFGPPGIPQPPPELVNYYDAASVAFSRTDSSGYGYAELRFYRDAAMRTNQSSGGYDKNISQFYAEGTDYEFVGNTDLLSSYFRCRGLKFPSGGALNGPFQQLVVRGRAYNEVVAFIGTARGATCRPVSSSYMQELYYDRQAGLVRMVSLAGEVWDRVL